MRPILEAENLTRLYRSSGRGIQGVGLRVGAGQVFGLMGPNGSGKSTLLRVLSTAVEPASGAFHVGGADGMKEKRKVRASLGLMVDRPTHYDDLSGMANAYLFARAYGVEESKAESVLGELFEFFDLAEYADDRVKTYSYGMSKKLALIEALAHGPDLLLLDEPSLGLDYTAQLAFARKVRELADTGVAIVIASNNVDEVESLCDRVAFLHRGRLVQEGTLEELIATVRGVRRILATLRSPVEFGPSGTCRGGAGRSGGQGPRGPLRRAARRRRRRGGGHRAFGGRDRQPLGRAPEPGGRVCEAHGGGDRKGCLAGRTPTGKKTWPSSSASGSRSS